MPLVKPSTLLTVADAVAQHPVVALRPAPGPARPPGWASRELLSELLQLAGDEARAASWRATSPGAEVQDPARRPTWTPWPTSKPRASAHPPRRSGARCNRSRARPGWSCWAQPRRPRADARHAACVPLQPLLAGSRPWRAASLHEPLHLAVVHAVQPQRARRRTRYSSVVP
jgi:hypothetical protein